MKKTIKPLGTVVYAVPNSFLERENKNGARIVVCKIKTYRNVNGKILPVLAEVGNSKHHFTSGHEVHYELDKAIKAISNDRKTRKK